MDKAVGLLKGHYYGNIILLAVIFLLAIFSVIPLLTAEQVINITIERYAIMITIILIPVSLKFFAHQLKKIPRPSEVVIATEKYKKASFLRLYTISAVTLMHIILFSISRNMNFFWFTVVLFIVFLYCKPSRGELQSLIEEPEEKNLTEEEQVEQSYPTLSDEDQNPTGEEELESGEMQEQLAKAQDKAGQKQSNHPTNE